MLPQDLLRRRRSKIAPVEIDAGLREKLPGILAVHDMLDRRPKLFFGIVDLFGIVQFEEITVNHQDVVALKGFPVEPLLPLAAECEENGMGFESAVAIDLAVDGNFDMDIFQVSVLIQGLSMMRHADDRIGIDRIGSSAVEGN